MATEKNYGGETKIEFLQRHLTEAIDKLSAISAEQFQATLTKFKLQTERPVKEYLKHTRDLPKEVLDNFLKNDPYLKGFDKPVGETNSKELYSGDLTDIEIKDINALEDEKLNELLELKIEDLKKQSEIFMRFISSTSLEMKSEIEQMNLSMEKLQTSNVHTVD